MNVPRRNPEFEIADAIRATLESPNETDRNGEAANVVDGLYYIGWALNKLADAVKELKNG